LALFKNATKERRRAEGHENNLSSGTAQEMFQGGAGALKKEPKGEGFRTKNRRKEAVAKDILTCKRGKGVKSWRGRRVTRKVLQKKKVSDNGE